MNRLFSTIIFIALALFGSSCSLVTGLSGQPLQILAASELQDIEPIIAEASKDLGFPIVLEYDGGTLNNSRNLLAGKYDGQYDAVWMATNRYASLIGADAKLSTATKIATSPVALGIRKDKSAEFGWDKNAPTWVDIAEAAAEGEFTYGMTSPEQSNSGFSTLVSVATALADTGQALTEKDIEKARPKLVDFFQGHSLRSGSSGWLAEAFINQPDKADGIFNYESVIESLIEDGSDLQIIIPSDGVINADYPLTLLKNSAREDAGEKLAELTDWLLTPEHQQLIAQQTHRRPVDTNIKFTGNDEVRFELPFPSTTRVANLLVTALQNDIRIPGLTIFVVDTSGSMEGKGINDLKNALITLAEPPTDETLGLYDGFRNREKIVLLPFSSSIGGIVETVIDETDNSTRELIAKAASDLEAGGDTAIYYSVAIAYKYALKHGEGYAPSIVLMSDGENTAQISEEDFSFLLNEWDKDGVPWRKIPTFAILYGDADEEATERLTNKLGGRTFDSTKSDLTEIFREIRSYQ